MFAIYRGMAGWAQNYMRADVCLGALHIGPWPIRECICNLNTFKLTVTSIGEMIEGSALKVYNREYGSCQYWFIFNRVCHDATKGI